MNGWLKQRDVVRFLTLRSQSEGFGGDLGMGAGRLLGRTSQLEVELSQIKRQNHMTRNREKVLGLTFLIR